MKRFTWLKVLNSPFKRPKLRWYFGKTRIGVPYFLPRKWVKNTKEEIALLVAKRMLKHPNVTIEESERLYKNSSKSVPKTIGFDYCDLGWKTKWSDKDIRYEWSPLLSFVFFKWQIACWIYVEEPDTYWTAWIYYELHTDKNKSKRERIKQCEVEFPVTWTIHYGCSKKETVDYYTRILKKKYL